MTDQEMVAEMTRHADLCRDIRPDWATLFRAAAERIRVLGEEVKAARTFMETADPDHERGRDNGYDEWEAARAATDAVRGGTR